MRIGDRERDQAAECLREHVAAGRLDVTEFEQRLEVALTARYASDLMPLFVDLPAPRPDLPTARPEQPDTKPASELSYQPREAERRPQRPASVVAGWRVTTTILWAIAIVACIASGWHLWWLLFIPLVMGGGCGRRQAWGAQRMHDRVHRLEHRRW